ncbi:MAG: hypothetical protein IKW13_03435 [Thermoguttaceae bacterium]|nr:hypothetical protein [Thermoguttaceae bacterium]
MAAERSTERRPRTLDGGGKLDEYAERAAIAEVGQTRPDAEKQARQAVANGLWGGGLGGLIVLAVLNEPTKAAVPLLIAAGPVLLAFVCFCVASSLVEEWERRVVGAKARIFEKGAKI